MARGDVVVRLLGDTRDLERKFQGAGDRISGVGSKLTKTLTPAAAAVGLAFRQAFQEYDQGADTLRAGTGKTGAALASLESSAKNVAATATQGFGEVGSVMTEVAQRTSLTGKPLENLTSQILTLARLTGGDAKSSVEGITRLFGDWGVETKQQSARLNELFRTTQATGVPVERLAELMVKFGAPLRQFNFSFSAAAATLAKFEREGVNTELVMGALRIALGKFSGQGEEAQQELEELNGQAESARGRLQSLADGVASASSRLGDLRENVTGAQTRIGDLARELDKAKASLEEALAGPSGQDMEGASIAIERAKLREADATNEIEDAENALRDARGKGSLEDIERAELRVKAARLSAREAALGVVDAEQRLNDLKKKGTESDEEVISARERVAAITRQMGDAENDLADAHQAVADGQRDLGRAQGELEKGRAEVEKIEASIKRLESLKTTDAAGALRDTFDAIKGAKNDTEAAGIAMEVFGKRAGADMAAAIREGRFDIEDLQKIIASSGDTLQKAGDDTLDFTDKLSMLKNKAIPVIGPVGEIGMAAAGIAAGIGPAMQIIPKFGGILTKLGGVFLTVGRAAMALFANPIGLAILAVVAVGILVWRHWDKVKAALVAIWGGIKKAAVVVFDFLKKLFFDFTPVGLIINNWKKIAEFLSGVWDGIKTGFGEAWDFVKRTFKGAINFIIDAWNKIDFSFKVKVPKWVPGIGGKGFEMKDLFPDIPRLAKGGIVTKPIIAELGERGPEAVIPLDRLSKAAGKGGNTYHMTFVIPPTVDKGAIGKEVVGAIKAYEARNGAGWRKAG